MPAHSPSEHGDDGHENYESLLGGSCLDSRLVESIKGHNGIGLEEV